MNKRHLLRAAVRLGVCAAVFCGSLRAQTAPAAGTAGVKSCQVQHVLANDANVALAAGEYAKAAGFFQHQLDNNPASSAAKVGLVESRLGEEKIAEAYTLAARYAAETPSDPLLQNVYGEVRFRRGEVGEAATAFNAAMHLDQCIARVHYNVARFQRLNGNFLTAQRQLDLAHQLSPDDPAIRRVWERSHEKPPSAEEQVAKLSKRLDKETLTAEQRKNTENHINQIKSFAAGGCVAVNAQETAKIPMFPILSGDNDVHHIAMDVELNGKRRRLVVDTGASGLTITRSLADSIGLTAEADLRIGGLGDEGSTRSFTAHVDSLRIGGMEIENCLVTVLDKTRGLDIDGLIGPDVFGQWVVTLDIPSREMRLAPLPKRPGETAAAQPLRLETHGASGTASDHPEDGLHDRYMAPEMQDWTHIYRDEHFLIVPTRVNDLPAKLFIMDTGAFSGSLTPDVGREVGRLVEVDTIVRGLSGAAAHVYTVDKQVTLAFAGVSQPLRGITVMNSGGSDSEGGVAISGFIGFTTLRELIISIDYRDDLVKIVFDPKHGFHSNGQMVVY